ncbi:GATA zinc finger domain-containing protein 14-like [Metopolophium dirhodum]|uniref:GATA zinc finger domain-containing protein 14-like n=1 Tax=Metopolophium dirhodum TaxID=44670 RepID=UPI00298F6B1D|nr:GATA zinc finger domain-containing protein 14-like [Metopolophium dirhodum]
MLFTYLLASALAMSAVFGGPSGPPSRQITYAKEHKTIMQSDETAQVMAVGDRSSNLKFVLAIQSSKIWEEIKKRSLTINTSHGLDDEVIGKSPDDLTDEELAQLKQACHDGLKCVAVDQLLVLKQVKEQLGDGKVSVRMVITKITQVLTQYTTEYHEDVYQYEAVQQSDDQSKVYESVTTIVEDNKELCQIDLAPATEQSYLNNDDANTISTTEQSYPKKDDGNTIPAAVNNKNTVNYNTFKNYNINNGTVNSATINIEPHSGVDGDSSNHETPPVNSNAHGDTTDGPTGHKSVINAAKNDAPHKRARPNYAQGSRTAGRPATTTDDQPESASTPIPILDDRRKPIDQPLLMITDGPSSRDDNVNGSAADIDTQNSDHGKRYRRSRPDGTGRRNSANTDEPAANNKIVSNRSNGNYASGRAGNTAADGVNNNTVELDNSTGSKAGGENDSDSDIVSAGSHNTHSSRKGLVEDGFLNNGNMKVKNVDNSNRNKGTVKGAKANNGIINVGTTNNGPVNYGTSKAYTNNGTSLDMDSHDIRQYVDNIDKMYSTILNEFAKK